MQQIGSGTLRGVGVGNDMLNTLDEDEHHKTWLPASSVVTAALCLGRCQVGEDVAPGDKVEGRFLASESIRRKVTVSHRWYPGTIVAVNSDGTYNIKYDDDDDDDEECNVLAVCVRARPTID